MDMDQEQTTSPMPTPQPLTPKPKRKAPIWLVIILVILLLAVSGVAAYFIWFNKPSENKVAKCKTPDNSKVNKTQDKTQDKPVASDPNTVTADELKAAYAAVGFSPDDNIIFTIESSITNSSVKPYQIVKANVHSKLGPGGFFTYFYREGPTGAWQYGFGGQQASSCYEYLFGERPILRKAFADLPCYTTTDVDSKNPSPTGTYGADK